MVRCRNGSLYTGISTDVERRFGEHCRGTGAKYLKGRGPLELVLSARIGEKGPALSAERRVKKLPKKRKEELVKSGVLPGIFMQ